MKKIGLILARRLRGDLLLTDDPLANRQARIISPGAWLTEDEQGVMEIDAVQNYRAGTRLAIDERVYRYAHVDAERKARPAYGVFPKMTTSETGAPQADADAGDYVVYCTAVAGVGVDDYAEGYLEVWGIDPNFGLMYKIKSNTVAAAPGATFAITLYDALVADVAIATETLRLFQNPYLNVVSMRQRQIDGVATDWRKVSAIGVPNRFIPADKWGWIQTWGPCVIVGDSGTEGVADSERCMQFGDNLSVLRLRDLGDGLGRHQIGGFVLPPTTDGYRGLFNLQITP